MLMFCSGDGFGSKGGAGQAPDVDVDVDVDVSLSRISKLIDELRDSVMTSSSIAVFFSRRQGKAMID
jgi:hypothetical protein